MPLPRSAALSPASLALGFAPGPGDALVQQRDDQVEDELRKKRLGAGSSPALQALFGMTGIIGTRGAMP